MLPDFSKADQIIRTVADRSRFFLHEHEVYDLLRVVGIGNAPECIVIESPDQSLDLLKNIAGDRLVLKIVHPRIAHKTDIGGIEIVERAGVPDAVRRILAQAPRRQAQLLMDRNEIPEEFRDLSSEELVSEFEDETVGVLVYPFVDSPAGFGTELFLGMRETREFGPIINAGLGGLDTELYAKELGGGRAGATVSPGASDEIELFKAFQETIAFETLTGRARGHKRLVEDEKIADLLERFHALVWRYSPFNPDAPVHFTECEMNPFLCRDGELVPVDGLLRFRPVEPSRPASPVGKIEALLKPKNICVIGVSAKGMNLGRVILRNLLKGGFTGERLAIVKDGDREIDQVKCYPGISDLPGRFDLVVLSVGATQVPSIVAEIIDSGKAESIILITGGMGEKEGAKGLEDDLKKVLHASRGRDDRGPVVVGPNSLGIICVPGGYDTMFVPASKLPKNPDNPIGKHVALISQSGAFMISRMSKLYGLVPRYAISTGNQADLGIADFVEHLTNDSEVRVFACYAEGLGRMEGLHLAEAARKITRSGRHVIVYKAGRSVEGRKAASGHTAAIAGDWDVADAVLTRSGCMVARSFAEWQNLIMLASTAGDRPIGEGRIAAVSNAGFETVGMADNLREPAHFLTFAQLSPSTLARLQSILKEFRLDDLVNIGNPLDITPMAVDRAHVEVIKALGHDPGVDFILHGCVPLSPQMKTLAPGGPEGDGIADPQSFPQLLIEAVRAGIGKPLAIVLDSGELYNPMEKMFLNAGIPVFRSADEATRTLGRFVYVSSRFGPQIHQPG